MLLLVAICRWCVCLFSWGVSGVSLSGGVALLTRAFSCTLTLHFTWLLIRPSCFLQLTYRWRDWAGHHSASRRQLIVIRALFRRSLGPHLRYQTCRPLLVTFLQHITWGTEVSNPAAISWMRVKGRLRGGPFWSASADKVTRLVGLTGISRLNIAGASVDCLVCPMRMWERVCN